MKKIFLTFFLFIHNIAHSESENLAKKLELLEMFSKVLYMVETQYYQKVDVKRLVQGALKGMMETLDPHSSYLPEEIYSQMRIDTDGEFGGIGIEVTIKDGGIIVVSVMEGTPAAKIGLKSGDRIVKVNQESISGNSLEEVTRRMKGKSGSKINLGVFRVGSDKILSFDIIREVIKISPVKSYLIEESYAYVRLIHFQKNSGKSIEEALQKIKKQNSLKNSLKGIILDLRNNPGGLLDEAVTVSSLFLKEGPVVSIEGRDPAKKEIRYILQKGEKLLTIPMVVLIDGSSASASEIVAGALQDYERAIIVGERSFGKGSVQSLAKIDENTGIKLTVAQYLTPKGRRIQADGIHPDIEIQNYDVDWNSLQKNAVQFVREEDLKNHLGPKKKEKEITAQEELSLSWKKDYQLIQAINILKTAVLRAQKSQENVTQNLHRQ